MSLKVFDEVEDVDTVTLESTDGSINDLFTISPVGSGRVVKVVAEVVAICTAGDAGDVGGWHLEAVFKINPEGVAMVGTEHVIVEEKDQIDWDVYFEVDGSDIVLKSVGDEGNTLSWKGKVTTLFINTSFPIS